MTTPTYYLLRLLVSRHYFILPWEINFLGIQLELPKGAHKVVDRASVILKPHTIDSKFV